MILIYIDGSAAAAENLLESAVLVVMTSITTQGAPPPFPTTRTRSTLCIECDCGTRSFIEL